MAKVSLTNLVNLQNETTAVSAINSNNAALTTAINNTLSRDGSTPNQMTASLDMNGQPIINLPAPTTLNSPARLVDVTTNPTITATLPITGNNTWTGTNTFNADAYFKSGRPWYDVRAFGCKGDNFTDDTANFQAALDAAGAVGGGIVYVPTGSYKLLGGVTVPTQVHLMGSGRDSCLLTSGFADVTVVTTAVNGTAYLEGFWILGKGVNGDTNFGATQPAFVMNGSNGFVRDVRVWGGSTAVVINGSDSYFLNLESGVSYGQQNVLSTGSNWFIRCKFDHSPIVVGVTTAMPYPGRVGLTHYNVGDAVISGGYSMVCTVAGTTGSSAPTLQNYGFNITDGSVTWQLIANSTYIAFLAGVPSAEIRFLETDFSGTGYTASFNAQSSASGINLTDCVFNANTDLVRCTYCIMTGCALNGPGYVKIYGTNTGFVGLHDNWYSGAGNFFVDAGVNYFAIRGNYMGGGTIQVQAGASDHYVIRDNVTVTVTDLGSGANKSVGGNVA